MRFRNDQVIPVPFEYTTLGATTNNLIINSTNIYITPTSNLDTITGFLGANINGTQVTIVNRSATNTLVLSNNSGSSTAGNKIYTSTGTDFYVKPGQIVNGVYDSNILGYRVDFSNTSLIEVTKSANQSIPNNVITAVTWNQESIKQGITHSNVTNPSRLTIASVGSYEGIARIGFATWGNVSPNRIVVHIYKNGVVYKRLTDFTMASALAPVLSIPFTLIDWTINDYLEVFVMQVNGAARNLSSADSSLYLKKIV